MCDTIGVTTGNSNLFHALYGAYNVHILDMSRIENVTQVLGKVHKLHLLMRVTPSNMGNNMCAFFHFRLYGFKIHPLAYELQYQAAANYKSSRPMHSIGYGSNKR